MTEAEAAIRLKLLLRHLRYIESEYREIHYGRITNTHVEELKEAEEHLKALLETLDIVRAWIICEQNA